MFETNTDASFSFETLTWQQVMEGVSGTALHNDADWFTFNVPEPTTVTFHLSDRTKLYEVCDCSTTRIATGDATLELTLSGDYMIGNSGYGCTECTNSGEAMPWSFGVQAAPVPEPSLAIMFGCGAVVVALSRRFAKVK